MPEYKVEGDLLRRVETALREKGLDPDKFTQLGFDAISGDKRIDLIGPDKGSGLSALGRLGRIIAGVAKYGDTLANNPNELKYLDVELNGKKAKNTDVTEMDFTVGRESRFYTQSHLRRIGEDYLKYIDNTSFGETVGLVLDSKDIINEVMGYVSIAYMQDILKYRSQYIGEDYPRLSYIILKNLLIDQYANGLLDLDDEKGVRDSIKLFLHSFLYPDNYYGGYDEIGNPSILYEVMSEKEKELVPMQIFAELIIDEVRQLGPKESFEIGEFGKIERAFMKCEDRNKAYQDLFWSIADRRQELNDSYLYNIGFLVKGDPKYYGEDKYMSLDNCKRGVMQGFIALNQLGTDVYGNDNQTPAYMRRRMFYTSAIKDSLKYIKERPSYQDMMKTQATIPVERVRVESSLDPLGQLSFLTQVSIVRGTDNFFGYIRQNNGIQYVTFDSYKPDGVYYRTLEYKPLNTPPTQEAE